MHARARVESVESVRQFRASLWQFAEQVRNALSDAESDVRRTQQWLEQEQGPWWTTQLRKRREAVQEAKRKLEDKRRYKTVDGSRPAAVEEEQALRAAVRRYEEAERRLAAVKRWRGQLDREAVLFHGVAQRLSRAIETDVPNAVATLDRLTEALSAYLALQAPQTGRVPGEAGDEAGQGMGMGLPASLVTDDAESEDEAEVGGDGDASAEAGEEAGGGAVGAGGAGDSAGEAAGEDVGEMKEGGGR